MTEKIPYKTVEVVWVDSESHPDWTDLKEVLDKKTLTCSSVGYLLEDVPDRIILAGSLNLNGLSSVASHITIPRVAVISIAEISPKKIKIRKLKAVMPVFEPNVQ